MEVVFRASSEVRGAILFANNQSKVYDSTVLGLAALAVLGLVALGAVLLVRWRRGAPTG